MDIINYLNKYINQSENILELLSLFLERDNYMFGAIFYKQNNNKYVLINHINKQCKCNESDITFEPHDSIMIVNIINRTENVIDNNVIDNNVIDNNVLENTNTSKLLNEYCAPYNITNILQIPVNVCHNIIGVIFLGNKSTPIEEHHINNITDLISMSQIIINKKKLMEDYKKIYSDSSYLSKDLFLANISHEIRTPLNGIIGYNQLLTKTNLSTLQQEYSICISQCSLQLMKIINDLIDFSKLSSGNMKIHLECFSVKEMVNEVYETMKQQIINKKHLFKISIKDSVPNFIITDKQKIIQVIINLLSNAINYTPINGKIKIKITNTDHILKVEIIDNGIGISDQDQFKLFNSFSQIQNSLTKGGTGLGLSISKKIVNFLNGDIDVISSLGKGSNFYFTCVHYPQEEFEKIINKDVKLLHNKHVLVVDDNMINRMTIASHLFEWNMQPVLCSSAEEALIIIKNSRCEFELALLDICMPHMNGVQLAQAIKEIKPYFPLIALSSASGYINTSNFDAKLDKPFNKYQLFNEIHKIITLNNVDTNFINNSSSLQNNNDEIITSPNSPTSYNNFDMNILISEDIIYNQTLLYNMVKIIGYNNIDVASDGQETIEKITVNALHSPYDILLLDLRMPKMDGYDVIDYIKKMGYKKPVIVVITASVIETEMQKCKECGIKYFMNKPIIMNRLKKVLHRVCIENNIYKC